MSVRTKKTEYGVGVSGFLEAALCGNLRRRPIGKLMQRILREHPEASVEDAMLLFREAVADDRAAFEDLVTHALRRSPPKQQEDGKDRRSGRPPMGLVRFG